ncbi:phage holin family protein [Streptomyces malaysiensis]|uniref:phage holin family protein n=1 Tax=Streptomyces malaysiensis TaxID=92644 RepID=UPI003D2F6604|nr:phage holin family protein [Streptomyces malaysiensis]
MSDKSAYPKAGLPTAGDLAEPVARAVREEVRRELRERSGGRAFRLYGGAVAAALYAGGALTACLVLLFAIALPAWVAALIVFVLLLGVAAWLKTSAARGAGPGAAAGPPAPSAPSAPSGPADSSGPSAPPTPPGSGAPPGPGAAPEGGAPPGSGAAPQPPQSPYPHQPPHPPQTG